MQCPPQYSPPQYILFAGVNGAGKSTLYKTELWRNGSEPSVLEHVNPDEILLELGGNPARETDQLKAGKEAVRRMKNYFANRQSFTQETTLSGRTSCKQVAHAKACGFEVVIHYVGVANVSLAQKRIAHRVSVGGHDVNPELVERRYKASLANLAKSIDCCKEVHVYDNTLAFKEIAAWSKGTLCWWGCSASVGTWLSDALLSDAWQR